MVDAPNLELLPRRSLRKRTLPEAETSAPEKRQKCSASISGLPDELLIKILSYLPRPDCFINAPAVCSRWRDLTMDKVFSWTTIEVGRAPETCTLKKWIETAKGLTHLSLTNRSDLGEILNKVVVCSRYLTSINIVNCWSSPSSRSISVASLKTLFKYCRALKKFRFENVLFNQRRYFHYLISEISKYREWSYSGWVSNTQLKYLLRHSNYSFAKKIRLQVHSVFHHGFFYVARQDKILHIEPIRKF